MIISDNWQDYEILEAAEGEKVERWGKYILRRPDPQAIWKLERPLTKKVDAYYHRSREGGGHWEFFSKMPERWTVSVDGLSFYVRPTGFKHTGLFPEQAANWSFIRNHCKEDMKVLNLFAYTGGATLAALSGGADAVHVDASKGMVAWAKENVELSGLSDRFVRYIVDDCEKFVQREIRRGNKYDGIIMDPPSYGRGPGGEMWKLENKIFDFVKLCTEVLSDNPKFFIINSYTTGLQPTVLDNMLKLTVMKKFGGTCTADEIGLPVRSDGIVLPCGATARWECKK
ncbi:MAG: class I SAM-dependent methyltransferase [Clostridia bacterium]|nr:class I SAM-dependent methyltransferase [Clostridia bacterium]